MAGPISFGYQVLGFGAGKKPAAAASTTKITVTIAEFDSDDDCACSLSSTVEVWEDDANSLGAGLGPSVNDWLAGEAQSGSYVCAKVTGLNATGTAVGYTVTAYNDCTACNEGEGICSAGDGGGDGPGGP